MPDLPIICDPSHICGRRDTLAAVAQQAIDLDFDGLMLESHPDPDNAWSDAKQQVTAAALKDMLEHLTWRHEPTNQREFQTALAGLREQINQLDTEIMQLIGRRMGVAQQIGPYKKDNDITILQTNRYSEILDRSLRQGEKLGLSPEFVHTYLEAVHLESINRQNKVMNS